MEFSSDAPLFPRWLGIGLPTVVHDPLNPFERHVRPELKLLNDLFAREFGVPLPHLANADSGGRPVIEMPPDVFVHGAAPRSIPTTFLQQCISPSDPKRVRGSQVANNLRARDVGVELK